MFPSGFSKVFPQGKSTKDAFLQLLNKKLKPYNLKISNLTSDWADGAALAALIDAHVPGFLVGNERLRRKVILSFYCGGNSKAVVTVCALSGFGCPKGILYLWNMYILFFARGYSN